MAPPRLRIPRTRIGPRISCRRLERLPTARNRRLSPTRSAAAGCGGRGRIRDRVPRSEARAVVAEVAAAPLALHPEALRARLRGGHAVGVSVFGPRHVVSRRVAVAVAI